MDRYEEILSKMTLEEKASLCSGKTFWETKEIERLGVPSVWLSDGPHGLRKEKQNGGGTNIMQKAETATCFPPESTIACSWDENLIEEVGAAIAEEAKAHKVTTVLGPGVNIKRSPLCGRNFEYLSEDPFLTARMGAAYVKGVQKNNVGVSVKHFCANNQEHIRMSINTVVDERTLREIYISAFEYIVKREQPQTIMSSYNRVNGTYMAENKRLLTDVLRGEWGFKGIVVSDWGAINVRTEGIKAGNDLEMPGNNGINDRNIVKAVKDGTLDEKELDKVVLRMLKFAFESKESIVDGCDQKLDEHHVLARKAAAKSAVLLKNEEKILPLKKETSVAVIGALAKNLRYQGSGSSHINPPKTISFTDAMDNEKVPYTFAEGYTLKGDGYNKTLIKEACDTAKNKDAVLVFIGLTDVFESEGFDREHMLIPSSHGYLVNEIAKVNKNIIVVLCGGSPVEVSDWDTNAKAILNVYLGGQAGGESTFDIVYGAVNPSGKLAETYPYKNEDNLTATYFPMGPRSVEYRESVYVGYRYFDSAKKEVKYPFGYGLSYTEFEYSPVTLSSEKIVEGEPLTASVTVKNIGDVAGEEIVQLYVKDIESTIFRPEKELKGFEKVYLEPGEEKNVNFELNARSFAYYNTNINDWHVESGEFEILVGASSRDIKASGKVYVKSLNPNVAVPDYRKSAPSYYAIAGVKEIPDNEFIALGVELEGNAPYKKGELTLNNSVGQTECSGVGRFLSSVLALGSRIVAAGTENPDMIIKSIKDMPLRSFSGFTGGMVSQMTVDGLVDMCNGTKGGFRKFCRGFKKENR